MVYVELPKAPGQIQLVSVHARSAEIQWLSATVSELPVEYRVQLIRPFTNWSFNYTVSFNSDTRLATTLSHLRPYTNYLVSLNAVNSAGIGPSSPPLQFQTLEEGN